MEQNKKKRTKGSSTKIIPPKKKKVQNLSRDEVRSINKKKVRRKRKARRIALLAGLALVVVCAGIALVLAVFFKTGTIQVKGDKVYADAEIIAKSGIEKGSNLFLVDEEKVNQTITSVMPFIKSVTIERDLPDTVIINVKATREVAALPYGAGFILVDEAGKVLDRDSSMLRDGVAVVDGVQLKGAPEGGVIKLNNDDVTNRFVQLLGAIKNSGLQQITGITLTKKGDFELKYDDRITVLLGSDANLLTKLQRAQAAIEREDEINAYSVGVLDLTTEPYAYFRAGERVEDAPETTVEESNNAGDDNKQSGEAETAAVTGDSENNA